MCALDFCFVRVWKAGWGRVEGDRGGGGVVLKNPLLSRWHDVRLFYCFMWRAGTESAVATKS